MSKSIKFRNGNYIDSSSIAHSRNLLSDILNNLVYGKGSVEYNPAHLTQMTSENRESIIDTSKTYLFHTNWKDYASHDSRFPGVLGIYIKGYGTTSTGGVAIIFYYGGAIGVNVRIDNNRWSGWRWVM